MTLIEALKVNGKARRKGYKWYIDKSLRCVDDFNGEDLGWVTYNDIMSEDWEPVREQKVWEGEYGDFPILHDFKKIPFNAKVKITWEE
jgi:hypothetical protein